jgi:hypothetical protein
MMMMIRHGGRKRKGPAPLTIGNLMATFDENQLPDVNGEADEISLNQIKYIGQRFVQRFRDQEMKTLQDVIDHINGHSKRANTLWLKNILYVSVLLDRSFIFVVVGSEQTRELGNVFKFQKDGIFDCIIITNLVDHKSMSLVLRYVAHHSFHLT